MIRKTNKTVFVGMSGGVDSSVAAALLKRSGFTVVGVFMKPYQPDLANSQMDCLWKQDREDALRVAAKLGIPSLTWDFSKEYEKYVANYMIKEYKRGLTPNPDVMCNKFIKFGLFLDKALESGADYIATGHYVRKLTTNNKQFTVHKLLKAKDLNKDQSYFLYTLTQKQLNRCLFPIGDYTKNEVRKIAKKFGLPNWDKKDSQGVCFVGPLEVKEFLKRNIRSQKGLVLRKSDGRILGEHDGVWFYTIGQRHGMNLAAGQSYYVVDKDPEKNIIFVDRQIKNRKSDLQISGFNWVNKKNNLPLDCRIKTRYRQKEIDCIIIKNGLDKALVKMKENNLAIAPGQAAVFYKGDEVLGGGIIT